MPAPQTPAAQNNSTVAAPTPATTTTAAGSAGTGSTTTTKTTGAGGYQNFKGDGSTGAGWPDKTAWIDFETAFSNNKPTMLTSDSEDEVNKIKDSINSVSASTGVQKEFILAVIIQESRGDVRVGSTAVDHLNPGLMQSHQGVDCIGQTPCPDSVITQMIQDGTGGTSSGDGLKQGLSGSQAIDVYKAARIYNSGSLDPTGDLAANGATPCYSSDIANRLIGFLGDSPCVDANVVPGGSTAPTA